jgi:hypothetical protein
MNLVKPIHSFHADRIKRYTRSPLLPDTDYGTQNLFNDDNPHPCPPCPHPPSNCLTLPFILNFRHPSIPAPA